MPFFCGFFVVEVVMFYKRNHVMFRIIIWKDNFYLFVYVFFLKISLFSRVIVFLNRLVPINQCPTESNTSKTLLFYRHAQDLKNSTNIADMMMI